MAGAAPRRETRPAPPTRRGRGRAGHLGPTAAGSPTPAAVSAGAVSVGALIQREGHRAHQSVRPLESTPARSWIGTRLRFLGVSGVLLAGCAVAAAVALPADTGRPTADAHSLDDGLPEIPPSSFPWSDSGTSSGASALPGPRPPLAMAALDGSAPAAPHGAFGVLPPRVPDSGTATAARSAGDPVSGTVGKVAGGAATVAERGTGSVAEVLRGGDGEVAGDTVGSLNGVLPEPLREPVRDLGGAVRDSTDGLVLDNGVDGLAGLVSGLPGE